MTREPRVPYRETITKKADSNYRHKKQSGGHGQFGEVYIRLAPRPRGSGFEFKETIFGGSIPKQYIPGVEKGLIEALEEGVLGKFPVVDVEVELYDGKYHDVDSSELSFKIASRTAFKMGMEKAGPHAPGADHGRAHIRGQGVHGRHPERRHEPPRQGARHGKRR